MQQGDTLGSLLFSLSIYHFVYSLQSDLNVFYVDDGTLGGTLQDVMDDFHRNTEKASLELGLILNHKKNDVCA